MIQLATSPSAARSFRPAQGDEKGAGQELQRRGGHAWPFISRQVVRPPKPADSKPAATGS